MFEDFEMESSVSLEEIRAMQRVVQAHAYNAEALRKQAEWQYEMSQYKNKCLERLAMDCMNIEFENSRTRTIQARASAQKSFGGKLMDGLKRLTGTDQK
jgi:hypothetical protein